ncbi:hypothetical protein GCM10011360_17420 [Primorskyibacter flagellatus]|uniref:Uncharacterized protein n=1 Tax=Primorskyibacter flagellatus TaxID=1387277 RepID=A0A917A5W1_9RHOB|nr:hypothetical protein [Primorskyibacter flagellatus]GGE29878.1 hypothetical protein GCM10011360_17420 [Primorskyibacter flagellatus]
MAELNELPAIEPADVTDDDFLLIYDNSAASTPARRATRAQVLQGVAREGGNHNFSTSEINDLTVSTATLVSAKITTELSFDEAGKIQKVYRATADLTTVGTADGAGENLTATVTGIVAGDYLAVSFAELLPDGLTWQAWISAADTVTIRFFNMSGGAIGSDTYTIKILAFRSV